MSMPNNSAIGEAAKKSLPRASGGTYSGASARFVPQLDGVRGLAILAVMATHLMASVLLVRHSLAARLFSLGAFGVDLFFVLSGFLITGILLDTRKKPKFFLNFYARRALRIWPLYYAFVFFAFVVVPHIRRDLAVQLAKFYPWEWYVFFLQNLFIVPHAGSRFLGITWSIAIRRTVLSVVADPGSLLQNVEFDDCPGGHSMF